MLKVSKFILVGIVALAAFLRIYGISNVPPALNWDEVSHGYNAYSILNTGKDEWGVSYPAIFRAYGDYKLPVYIYLTAIFESFLGLTALAVRLSSVLAGIGIVVFTYFLGKRLYSSNVGLLAAFLVALEPWSLFLSRGAFEGNLGAFFIVSGIYYLLIGVEKAKNLLVAALLLGLSVFTYNSARIFVPLFLIFFFLIYRNQFRVLWEKRQKYLLTSLVVLFAFLGGMFWQMVNGEGQERYKWLAILDDGGISAIENRREVSNLPEGVERFLYNKPIYFLEKFGQNYVRHFSPEFLFLTGGTHYQFSLPKHGLLYLINLPFVVWGAVSILRSRKKEAILLLGWLLLAPVASSLTREGPHALRAITLLPIPMLLSALGFLNILNYVSKSFGKIFAHIALLVYVLLISFFAQKYLTSYFQTYPKEYSWAWQYGNKEAIKYAKENYAKYDKIIMTKKYGEPHEFILFSWPWDPNFYQNDPNLVRYGQSDWFWVDGFDKFVFVNDWDIPKTSEAVWMTEKDVEVNIKGKNLLITSPDNYPPGWQKVKTVEFLDGKPAFDLLENVEVN